MDKLKAQKSHQRWYSELRTNILIHYGNGKLACVKCGFSDIRALQLDHLNGGGREEFRRFGNKPFYIKLRNEGYPEGYQTLCANCNFIKGHKNWTS
jgi:hypothetical protein